jgi:transcription initiation factor IIF auxiliary subunit
MEQILKQILGKLNNLEEGQKSLFMMQKILGENQKSFENRLERVEKKIDHLELGQQEIKETLKYNMKLVTENLTAIRQDMRKMRN